MQITTIGLDVPKNVFQVHGIDASEKVVVRKERGAAVLALFEALPSCLPASPRVASFLRRWPVASRGWRYRQSALHQRRQDPTGTDGVAGHARRSSLERHHFCDSKNTVLCRHVGHLVNRGYQPVRRSDVNDPAPVPAEHGWQRRADCMERR